MPAKKTFKISGTGCALVDYLYQPINFGDKDFTRYLSKKPGDGGLSPGKLVFTEEYEKFAGEPYSESKNRITNGMKPVGINIGGPSVVSMIHASQLLYGLPAEVVFYGCRGKDEPGTFLEEQLKRTPLKIGQYKNADHFTPFTDVLCDPDFDKGNGERIFINNIGAAWDFMPMDLDESFFGSDITAFGGTALVPNIHSSLFELLSKAKTYNSITVVNTVFDFLSEKKDPFKPWQLGKSVDTYRYIDLLITDMEESLRLSGTDSIEAAMRFFKSTGVGAVIVTHGSKDLYYFADNDLFGQIPLSRLPVSDKIKSELIRKDKISGDTTGCGDNFAGGIIGSIAMQLINKPGTRVDLIQAIAMGVVSGGFTCFYNGGTYIELFPGQKAELINPYYHLYLKQIGT